MELTIKVQKLGCGRVMAKVLPDGPVCEADQAEVAVQFAKQAHQAFLLSHHGWLYPELKTAKVLMYRVEAT